MAFEDILHRLTQAGRVIANAIQTADMYFSATGWSKDGRGRWVSPDGEPVSQWLTGPKGKAMAASWLKEAAANGGLDVERLGISLTQIIDALRKHTGS